MRLGYLFGVVVVAVAGLGGGFYYQRLQEDHVLDGFYRINGRIEVERVDVATKVAGRVQKVLIEEGDRIAAGAMVAQMDVAELLAEKASAEAAVSQALQQQAEATATVSIREADLRLAEISLDRVSKLRLGDTVAQSELDSRQAERDVKAASREAAKAAVGTASAAVEAARARLRQLEATLDDMTLSAPVGGRVEYKLAQPGEVLPAGGRVATLLDLASAYMTVFLPTETVGRVAYGDEARVVLDALPGYVLPAQVSFVAAEAQFTPKYVETADERQKLMYRVKLRFPADLLNRYDAYVKAGLTGNAYVRIDPAAVWPEEFQLRLPEISGSSAQR
ncbi:HlyD family secretion protein [Roseibium litorale]|uniref:HlyD family efflux transporter periplasmic adaptor subunit n=1 Tax=Roseibium litorale TaxID=2803841 RepID=A0ABR9CP68_9HYPH|nr:HlyD family efflux transporter periplasmic adaptor subunit [Roseibium litorale]MBD8892670.1 HlyD family efflux transporter periplasmic adaptor subunit [Roseibium litorale]